MSINNIMEKCGNIIIAAQPLFSCSIFFTFLLNTPPLWISWTIALIPWVIQLCWKRNFIKLSKFDIPVLIFIASIIIAFIFSSRNKINIEAFNTYFACVLIYYGIVNNSNKEKYYWQILISFLLILFLGIIIYTFIYGDNRIYNFNEEIYALFGSAPRINEIEPSYNVAGFLAVIAIPLLIALIFFQNKLYIRLTSCIGLIIFLFLLFLNGSGGALLSLIPGLILLFFIVRKWTIFLTMPFTAGLLGFLIYNWSSLENIKKMFPIGSITGRFSLWQETVNLFQINKHMGLGLGSWYTTYTEAYSKSIINPHNSYIQLYADIGYVSMVILIAAYIVFSLIVWKIINSRQFGWWYAIACGSISIIVVGAFHAIIEVNLTASILQNNVLVHYFALPLLWIIYALLHVAYNNLFRSNSDTSKI